MSNLSMYELTNEAIKLKQMLYNDEITEEELADTFETMQIAVADKLEGLGYVLSEAEADIKKLDDEKKHLDYVKKTLDNRVKRLKSTAKEMMEANDLSDVKCGRFTAKICKAGGVKPLTIIENLVPNEYMKVIYEVDKDKIREDLEAGKELSFARLEDRTTYLKIK